MRTQPNCERSIRLIWEACLICAVMVLPAHAADENSKVVPLTEGSKSGEEWSGNRMKMRFCWCPPGKFRMGSPPSEKGRRNDEGPVEVELTSGFWMSKYEVKQVEWERVMGSVLAQQIPGNLLVARSAGDEYPMHNLNFDKARRFCEKFTYQERLTGRLSETWTYQLPSEAQWEYACRAGTTTATTFGDRLTGEQAAIDERFPYPDALSFEMTDKDSKLDGPVPVGSYKPNAWGLHDLHGNVAEWCIDWYKSDLPGGVDPIVKHGDPTLYGMDRVVRGGNWVRKGVNCRSSSRSHSPPQGELYLGIRVVLVHTPPNRNSGSK